jgi:hypothetical protein
LAIPACLMTGNMAIMRGSLEFAVSGRGWKCPD